MTESLTVGAIASYLAATNWQREPETWRTASIWTSSDGHQVLLPARDGMGDSDLRVRELLEVIGLVETRPASDVAWEILKPMTDRQTYQLFSDGATEGDAPLISSVRALNGVRQLLDSAGRAFVEGPHVTFPGPTPHSVRDLLAGVRLSYGASRVPTFRVDLPLTESTSGSPIDASFARGVGVQLHDAIGSASEAVSEAAADGDLSIFDQAVTAGVSANLCQALSKLGGQDRQQPVEISFAWAYGVPSRLPPTTIRFEAGRGGVLADAARHLRHMNSSGNAAVIGLVESLHDDAKRADRWRIKVRGEVTGARGASSRRTLWVRLDTPQAYDLAIEAHREHQRVHAQGEFSVAGGRLELLTSQEYFALVQ